jgi:signal transduction histidine kinase
MAPARPPTEEGARRPRVAGRMSLWAHLFLAAAVSTAVGLAVVGLYVQHAATKQLAAFNRQRDRAVVQQVAASLAAQYRRAGPLALKSAATYYADQYASTITIRTPGGPVLYRVAPSGLKRPPKGPAVHAIVPLYPFGGTRIEVTMSATRRVGPGLSPVLRSLLSSLLVASLVGFLASLLLSTLVGNRIVRQLQHIAQGARRLGAGEWGYRVAPQGPAEVRALADDFNRMAGAIEAGESERQRLMADVAHELRTPLSILEGYLEALREGVDVAGADPVAVAQHQARILAQLVDELQDVALAEARQLEIHREPVDLGALVRDVGTDWQWAADTRRIRFTVRTDPVAPVWGDPRRLRRVVANLVGNAMKYTPGGGRVDLTLSPDAATGGARITVADNGPGIAPEHQRRVFDRLYRVDPSRSRHTGGFGLGLSIAKELVELHGGRIDLTSEVGAGSRFVVTLPPMSTERGATS